MSRVFKCEKCGFVFEADETGQGYTKCSEADCRGISLEMTKAKSVLEQDYTDGTADWCRRVS